MVTFVLCTKWPMQVMFYMKITDNFTEYTGYWWIQTLNDAMATKRLL